MKFESYCYINFVSVDKKDLRFEYYYCYSQFLMESLTFVTVLSPPKRFIFINEKIETQKV